MSPIKRMTMTGLLLIGGLLIMGGCSSNNGQSLTNPDTGAHDVAGWLPAGHEAAAQADVTTCQQCHGADYSGGVSNVSCSQCHLGGYNAVHPASWGTSSVDLDHGPYVQTNSSSACANEYCHGTLLTGVDQSGPSCTSCHLGGIGSSHPTDWATPIALNHASYVEANGTSSCANAACHGTDLLGNTGPSCSSCHLGGATAVHPADWTAPAFANHAQYVLVNGVSSCQNNYCHGSSLTGVAGSGPSCTSCHMGGVYSVHPAIFSIPTVTLPGHAIYLLSTGSTYPCSNAACHGVYLQGVPDSGPSCASCHNSLP